MRLRSTKRRDSCQRIAFSGYPGQHPDADAACFHERRDGGNCRRHSLTAASQNVLTTAAGLSFESSYDRGASRPAVVVWITSRRSALVSRPLARVHQRTIGDAMKMDEYVPTITPIRNENAKSLRTGPPKKYNASTVNKTVPPVRIVRDSVSLIEVFITSAPDPDNRSRKPLRIRSKTTILSLIE